MADAFGMCYYKLLKILLVAVLSFFQGMNSLVPSARKP